MRPGKDGSQTSARAVKIFSHESGNSRSSAPGNSARDCSRESWARSLFLWARGATVASHQPRADYLTEKYGIKAHTNNAQAVSGADLVLICLKPQQVKGFLHEVKKKLETRRVIISVCGIGDHLIDRA